MTDAPRFLTVAATARLLGVSDMTLYRQLAAGEFPGIRIGKRYVIPAKALDTMEDDAIREWSTVDAADYVVSKRGGSSAG